jgi:hypothetical protein
MLLRPQRRTRYSRQVKRKVSIRFTSERCSTTLS